MKKLTGAQIVIESLIAEGVDVIFGYPGGAILPTYDALLDSRLSTSWSATSRAPPTWPKATRESADGRAW